jgi:plastocyanin
MRAPLRLILFATLFIASTASARDIYLSIAGSVNNFRTDTRIFNPSSSKDITINAYFLPVNADNTSVAPVSIIVPKRKMLIYDDVVSAVFHGTGVGAIRLSSSDDFVATSRIYAQTATGTLGQFMEGRDITTAQKKGVVIQLKSSSAFRTNIGFVNPNSTAATVTLRLYDKDNNLVGAPVALSAPLPPYGATSPTNMSGMFNTSGADLTDSWISFESTLPLFAYGSVIDNATTDPTLVPFAADTDATTSTAPAGSFSVVASQFRFTVSPALKGNVGDTIQLHLSASDTTHGFVLIGPDGKTLVGPMDLIPGQSYDKSFTITQEGIYSFSCTHHTCGVGHSTMTGDFTVGTQKDPPGSGY